MSKKGTSNLNRPPRPWEYLIEDQVTRQMIYNTDATTDFWGRVVHKDWVTEPTPYEYKDAFIPEVFPDFGRSPADPSGQPGNYFVTTVGGDVTTIWFSTDYSEGQYQEATAAQIAAYLPIVANQVFSYGYNGSTDIRAVGTMLFTDPSGYGLAWSIARTATDPFNNTVEAFTIDASTGTIYASDLGLLSNSTAYTLTVTATSYFPGNLSTTATVTVNVTTVVYVPSITTDSPLDADDTSTAVATIQGTDPQNQTLAWTISGGANAGLFTIVSGTGVLTFLAIPVAGSYQVRIRATNTSGALVDKMFTVEVAEIIGPFEPTDLAGLRLWLDASDNSTITESAGLVSQWNDKSGQLNHFVQATAARKPTVDANSFATGYQGIGFNVLADSADYMTASTASSNFSFLNGINATIFIVLKPSIIVPAGNERYVLTTRNTGTTPGYSVSFNESGATILLKVLHQNAGNIIAQATAYNVAPIDGTGYIISETYNNSTSPKGNVYIANALVDTTITSNASISSPANNVMHIGVNPANAGVANGTNGRFVLAEILMYNTTLSSVDRTSVHDYLTDKWGL